MWSGLVRVEELVFQGEWYSILTLQQCFDHVLQHKRANLILTSAKSSVLNGTEHGRVLATTPSSTSWHSLSVKNAPMCANLGTFSTHRVHR